MAVVNAAPVAFAAGAASRWSRLIQRMAREEGAAPTRQSILVQAHRTRAMLAQVRRSMMLLLWSDECGLPLVLEDVRALDERLAALGLQPTALDAAEIALVGHECRQVYREASEARSAAASCGLSAEGGPSSHGMSLRWSRARQLQADTEIDVLRRLRARDARLEFLMRAHVRPRASA